jgi:hypothetical protein
MKMIRRYFIKKKIDELIDDGESNGCMFKGITYVIEKAVTLPLLEENN